MNWDEIFEWLNVDKDNEIWFDNIEDVNHVIEFIKRDGWKVNSYDEFLEELFSTGLYNYIGLWFSKDYEFSVGLRRLEDEDMNIIFYSDYPFAVPQVNIDVDQLSSLF